MAKIASGRITGRGMSLWHLMNESCLQKVSLTQIIQEKYISIARTSRKTDLNGISEGQSAFSGGLAIETYFSWMNCVIANNNQMLCPHFLS